MFHQFIVRFLSVKFYRTVYKNQFKRFGKNVFLICPLKINGIANIIIHDDVIVEYKSWLAAVPIDPSTKCCLEIGKGTSIGHFNHIYATRSIIIGQNVLTADKVYISDNLHGYENINLPIIDQPIKQINSVDIGDGTWIGENACIIGVKIGRNCVIGSNAVVTKDIPDYSVAVGIPAHIIKRFDEDSGVWRRTNNEGKFI